MADGDPVDYARGPQWHAQQARARAEWQQMRDLAITVPCPPKPHGCGVPVGVACVNRDGKPGLLKKFPAHPRRIAIARKAAKRG